MLYSAAACWTMQGMEHTPEVILYSTEHGSGFYARCGCGWQSTSSRTRKHIDAKAREHVGDATLEALVRESYVQTAERIFIVRHLGTRYGWHVLCAERGPDQVRDEITNVAGPYTTREQAEAKATSLTEEAKA